MIKCLKYNTTFNFCHTSFELVQTTLTLEQRSVHFFCLYRPPPSRKNKLTDSLFLEQFPNLLDYGNSIGGNLIILGDFNFHFDCPSKPNTSKLLDSINVFNLKQSVNQPTHKLGHILDWFLYRPDDNILQSTLVSHELASDHLCIVCHLDVSVPNPPPLFATKRNLRMINRAKFMHDIQENLTTFLHPTAEQLDNCLRSLLEKHAPATKCRVSIKKSVLHGIAVLGTSFALLKDIAEKQRGFGFPPNSLFINKSTKPLKRTSQT